MKRAFLLLATMLFVVSLTAWAQDTANLVGTVTDTTGAVIPNAKVTVANPDKGFTRDLVSNSAGAYSLSAVPIGNYVITAEAQGFEKLVRSGISLTVGQIQRVDLQLTLGQVTQEVTVTGNVPKVQTETSAISDVVTGKQISDLELNGRNFVTLALLIPGAVPDNGLNTSTVGVYGNNSISFNGNRMQYNNWEIDGGNNTDEGSASTFNTYPNLDTIAEFRISTSNYGADLGKHAGANIEVATKSGTKDFHGDAAEYNRNSAVGASDFFLNRNNQTKGFLNQNEYGYTLGGPVYIPGHYNTSKEKTFFYWSEDWRKIRQGQTIGNNVPTTAERNGDFSQCDPKSPNANALVITDGCLLPQLNGVAYDNVQSMPGFNQQAFTNGQDLLNGLVPLSNEGAALPDRWTTASPTATNWRQEQIRVDENISDKTQIFARWTQDAWDTVAVPSLWSWASYDTVKTPFGGPGKSAVIHITHSFKPNLMNEFIAAYTTDHIILTNLAADSVAGSLNRPSSFVMNHLFTANNSNPLLPSIELCGGLNFCTAEDASNHPWKNSNPILTWKDNLAWTHGNHTTKVGVYLENYRKNEQFGFNTQGFLYNGAGGSLTTGNALADMFLGRIQQYQEGTQAVAGVPVGGYPKGHWQMTDFEPYIQDDWKVSHKLTINLGLRYYSYTRIHDVSNPTIDSGFLPNQFNPAQEDPLLANGNINTAAGLNTYTAPGNGLVTCGTGSIPLGCQNNNSGLNFAPRFGFAYDPTGQGKTVIRGGYGIYFESGNGNEAQTEGGEGNAPDALSPSGFNILGYSNILPGAIGPTGYTAIPFNQGWPYVQQFNLNVQHQFGATNLFEIAYVGSLGRNLARARNISEIPLGVGTQTVPVLANTSGADKTGLGLNPSCDASGNCNVQALLINNVVPSTFFQPYQDFNNIQMKENTAVSSYNSLQMNFRHTFGRGLTFQAVYTWSHAIDNSTSTYLETSGAIDDQQLSRWKGTSDLNRTQVLTFNYVYELPFFKNSTNKLAKGALGGWEVSGISSFFTGEPADFNCGVSGFSSGIGGAVRCNTVGTLQINKTIGNEPGYGPTLQWYNPSTTAQPTASQFLANGETCMFGCMGRNVLTGPGRNNTDLAMLKNFSLPWFNGEHSQLQFRVESFNTFNHVQYQYVNTGCNGNTPFGGSCGSAAFGNASNGFVNSDWGPRVVQFGAKFIF
ncbi:MAG TPA: carboxypeptidase-like regulatory domain-containing protein [Terriglobia bacterium]|nr:carboxypeptidase-like regulatory domain-containing protein [Terriglobia bacterium]